VATLRDYFARDFARWMTTSQEHLATVTTSMEKIPFPVRVHEDLQAAAKFVSIYVPAPIEPIELTKFYVDDISQALKVGSGVYCEMGFGDLDKQVNSRDLVFTGRLFVYTEQKVPRDQVEQLREYCRTKDVKLVWLDTSYSDERNRFETPAAFICHDSRDKAEVAEPIASNLQALLCPVWYDEYSLGVGDSLRESIEQGIKEANKCILILSSNFFSNNGWTKAEFDSIYTREIIEQRHVILPVWHNVSKQEVYKYSPRLADRVAVNTSIGIKEVVRRLHAKLTQHSEPSS